MIVKQVQVSKRDLLCIPKAERVFLVLACHLLNELTALNKFLAFLGNFPSEESHRCEQAFA